jgi:hypothetical protein
MKLRIAAVTLAALAAVGACGTPSDTVGPPAASVAACEDAMRAAFDDAMNTATTPAGRPDACEGVPDADVEAIAGQILEDIFDEAEATEAPEPVVIPSPAPVRYSPPPRAGAPRKAHKVDRAAPAAAPQRDATVVRTMTVQDEEPKVTTPKPADTPPPTPADPRPEPPRTCDSAGCPIDTARTWKTKDGKTIHGTESGYRAWRERNPGA